MFLVGWDKQEIQIQPKGYSMFGYGMWSHRATEKRTALFARAFSIREDDSTQPILLCCLDFGCITHAMRSGVVSVLSEKLGHRFNEQKLVMLATHTHSGPGGCAFEALYNIPTPGFVPEHLQAVIDAVVSSLLNALKSEQSTELHYQTCQFTDQTPVGWNRSLQAYNRNPDVMKRTETETHLAINRTMQLIGFYRKNQNPSNTSNEKQLSAFISLFGVHATCLGNTLKAHDGDNKGYASAFSEKSLIENGVVNPVTIFAQATAGDVSPHFHGPKQDAIRNKIKGEQEYLYAQQNGRYQSELALKTLLSQKLTQPTLERDQHSHGSQLKGRVDGVLSYVDLSQIDVPAGFANGTQGAKTSDACQGASFMAGTPVDGKGTAKPIVKMMCLLSQHVRKKRLSNSSAPDYAYYQALYRSQAPKDIVIENTPKLTLGKALDLPPSFIDPLVAEMNRQVRAGAIAQSLLLPSVMPLQLIQIGQLALICCPGEITTTAGNRLIATVSQQLLQHSNTLGNLNTASLESETLAFSKVALLSYCNDYMGYITTHEEYQQQAYEGGHTLFGQWTHGAIQFKFQHLAEQLNLAPTQREYDQVTRPTQVPQQELERRTNHGNLKTAVR